MDMNYRGEMWEGGGGRMELSEGAEMGQLNSKSINILKNKIKKFKKIHQQQGTLG